MYKDYFVTIQARPPAQPEETGLKFGDGEQAKRKQQLQSERQQEYNDLLSKVRS